MAKAELAPPPIGRFWAPALMLVVLSFPCLPWPFLWDDFGFLSRALRFDWWNLLPATGDTLYRPISRDIYFWFVVHALANSPIMAHLANLLLAIVCLYLIALLVTRLAGERSGAVAAILFASAAWVPFLVGWASGAQDLLCLLFALLAFNAQLSGRTYLAGCAMALSILSKETGLALLPVMPMLAWARHSEAPSSLRRSLIVSASLAVGWMLIHPWPRTLVGGMTGRAGDYVGLHGSDSPQAMLATGLAAVNVTATRQHEWRADLIVMTIIAAMLAAAGMRSAQLGGAANTRAGVSSARLTIAGLSWFVLPILLTGALLRVQFPYYGFIPMVGLMVIAAPRLATARPALALAAVAAFLALGSVSRMAVVDQKLLAEQNFRLTAPAIGRVQLRFQNLRPAMPAGERVFVYVQAAGRHGIYEALYRGQPLRAWYKDPALLALDPLRDRPQGHDELLFWVARDLNVYEIDISTLKPRGEGTRALFDEYQKTLRAYALGVAGSGGTDRAVEILTTMPEYSQALRAYDQRTAAAILLAAKREEEAERLLAGADHFRRDDAIGEVAGLVAKPVPGLDLDAAAMLAFELDPTDAQTLRAIGQTLRSQGYVASADRFESYARRR